MRLYQSKCNIINHTDNPRLMILQLQFTFPFYCYIFYFPELLWNHRHATGLQKKRCAMMIEWRQPCENASHEVEEINTLSYCLWFAIYTITNMRWGTLEWHAVHWSAICHAIFIQTHSHSAREKRRDTNKQYYAFTGWKSRRVRVESVDVVRAPRTILIGNLCGKTITFTERHTLWVRRHAYARATA